MLATVSRTQVIHFYSICCSGCFRLGLGGSGDYLNGTRIISPLSTLSDLSDGLRDKERSMWLALPAPRGRQVGHFRSMRANISQQATPPHGARTQQRRGVDDTKSVGNEDIFRPVTCKAVDRTCLVPTPNYQRTQNEAHCPASQSYLTSSFKS
jgi:hypothetical protein